MENVNSVVVRNRIDYDRRGCQDFFGSFCRMTAVHRQVTMIVHRRDRLVHSSADDHAPAVVVGGLQASKSARMRVVFVGARPKMRITMKPLRASAAAS